jgi:transcriptional regulator with XRE-family HTH domain
MGKRTGSQRDQVLVAFGLAVQNRRREIGLSQEKAAERAGIHRTYFADVERGTRNVGLKNLIAIARALGVTPSALLNSIL